MRKEKLPILTEVSKAKNNQFTENIRQIKKEYECKLQVVVQAMQDYSIVLE